MRTFIDYDMSKVHELKLVYLTAMEHIQKELSPVDLNSPKQIVSLFNHTLGLPVQDAKIKSLEAHLCSLDSNSELFNYAYGVVSYLKLKYSLKNYIDCIIKHEKDGRVTLREVNGEYRMPNKQPISGNPEIAQCEKEM